MTEEKQSRVFTVRLPLDLLSKLKRIAKAERRSVNNFINAELEKVAERIEQEEAATAKRK